MNPAWFALFAGLYGFTAVALGAFAAHGLKSRLDTYALDIMHTATQYALVHAVVLLAISQMPPSKLQVISGLTMMAGTFLFAGSLYVLALTGIRGFGAVTPIGGVLLLIGWATLSVGAIGLLRTTI